MRNAWVGLSLCLMACGGVERAHSSVARMAVVTEASGGSTPVQIVTPSGWIGAAPAQSRLVVGGDGQTYVGVWIDAPAARSEARRGPLDLALVVDNSGSMSGAKIEHARMAAASLLESLSEGDIVSVYTFDSVVREIAPPTVVSSATRSDLVGRVQSIVPMGGTNMYDGLRVAEARIAEAPTTHAVRRIVLISDGMANIGPASPEALGDLAARGTESGAQVSAIGVGLEYDERTLGALAMRSAGRLYHLAEPSQMAAILHEELDRLASTVAADAVVEIEPAAGVQLLGVEAAEGTIEHGRLRVRLGSLHGGQHRELLVRARVSTEASGDRALGAARLVYREPGTRGATRTQHVGLRYSVTSDASAARASADGRVAAMVAGYEAAQSQLRAAQMLNEGQNAAAAQLLADAERRLHTVAAHSQAPAARERLERQASRISAGRARAASAPARASRGDRAGALQNTAEAYQSMGY